MIVKSNDIGDFESQTAVSLLVKSTKETEPSHT